MSGVTYSPQYIPCSDRAYYYRAKAVLRDNNVIWACARCSSTLKLEVHHIDTDITNNSISNLEPLCKSCHILEHNSN